MRFSPTVRTSFLATFHLRFNDSLTPGLLLMIPNAQPNDRRWRWSILFVLAIGTAITLFARFRAGNGFMTFYEDDYFYYLRVARSLASGHGSTYDGTHLTNGYHPLWMLVNVVLAKLFTGKSFFYALMAVVGAGVLTIYWFLQLCFRRYTGAFAACACAGLIATEALQLMTGGMEIVLTLPLLAVLCWYRVCRFQWRPASAAFYGLLCAAVVLSRLDSAILIALLLLFELPGALSKGVRIAPAALAFAVAAGLPIAIYLGMNLAVFHTLLPISGKAKELRSGYAPSIAPLRAMFFEAEPRLLYFLNLPSAIATLIATVWLARDPGRIDRQHRALLWALLVFPWVQILVFSIVSDWPIWPWYFYPLISSTTAAALVFLSRGEAPEGQLSRFLGPFSIVTGFALLALFSFMQWRNSRRPQVLLYAMYSAAADLGKFAGTHPGIYAMGDRAGVVGVLIEWPLVQLEGLVMDQAYLRNIQQRRDLVSVLRDYSVRYYISTDPVRTGGCFLSIEPAKAGPASPKMHGLFCGEPLVHISHNGYQTYIFDMTREKGTGVVSASGLLR